MANYYNEEIAQSLLKQYQETRSIEDRNTLLEYLIPVLEGWSNTNYKNNTIYTLDDLKQELFFTLVSSIDTYNKDKNTKLLSWVITGLYHGQQNLYNKNKKYYDRNPQPDENNEKNNTKYNKHDKHKENYIGDKLSFLLNHSHLLSMSQFDILRNLIVVIKEHKILTARSLSAQVKKEANITDVEWFDFIKCVNKIYNTNRE